MKPSPTLSYRIRTRIAFTTKRVGGGFYRGNRTGSLGAHTKQGKYIIDWRKVRHYVVPDLTTSLRLTPFVSRDIYPDDKVHFDEGNQVPYDPKKFGGVHYLRYWEHSNQNEYDHALKVEEYRRKAKSLSEGNAEAQENQEQPVIDEQEPQTRR